MELESFIFTVSVLLELVGAASVLVCSCTSRGRSSGAAEVVLIGCVCGLGSVTIISAMLHLFCGLISGGAVVLMGLAVIFLSERAHEENPLANFVEPSAVAE